jgi:hypothetical protein
MNYAHTSGEIQRRDLFKLIVAVALFLLLILLLVMRAAGARPAPATVKVEPTNAPATQAVVATQPPTLPAATETSRNILALTGNGAPGSTVEILIDGQAVGTAQVGGDGTWSFTTELAEPGDHTIGVRTAEAASTVTVTPTLAGGALFLTGNGEPGSEVQILIDGAVAGSTQVGSDGAWSFTTSLTEPGDHTINVQTVSETASPTFTTPTEGAELPPGEVRFTGTGEPGDEVILSDNGVLAGTAIVSSSGEWSVIYKPAGGVHTFGVRQAGNPALAATVTATVLSPPITRCVGAPGMNLGDVYIVGACDTLTKISRITGVSLSALIAANPQIKDPDVIIPGQVIDIPR